MRESLSFFLNELQPNSDVPDKLDPLPGNLDEDIEILVSALITPLKISSIELRQAAAIAQVRCKAALIIQRAIQANDDITITHWYRPELFQNTTLLSKEEKDRADLALLRKKILMSLRKNELTVDNITAEILSGSNLLTHLDKSLFTPHIPSNNP